MITLPASCKFCARTLRIDVDPGGAAMFGDLEDFVAGLACCNPCADHRAKVVASIDYIDRKKFDPTLTPETKREFVARAAEKFAYLIADFYRVQRVFEPDLVSLFMQKRADAVARGFENQIRKHINLAPLKLKSDPINDAKQTETP